MDDNKPDKPTVTETENPTELPDLVEGDDDLHNVEIHEEQPEPKKG